MCCPCHRIFTNAPNFINRDIEQLTRRFGVHAAWVRHLDGWRDLTRRLVGFSLAATNVSTWHGRRKGAKD
jgi:hypothetical protein